MFETPTTYTIEIRVTNLLNDTIAYSGDSIAIATGVYQKLDKAKLESVTTKIHLQK